MIRKNNVRSHLLLLDLIAYWAFDNTYIERVNGWTATSYSGTSFTADRYGNSLKALSLNGAGGLTLSNCPNPINVYSGSVWLFVTSFPNIYMNVMYSK